MGNEMSFFEAVKWRRSIRAFESRSVEDDQLQRIFECANASPSAGNLQGYEILVVRDAKIKQALVRAALGQVFLAAAPVVLVFFQNRK